MSVAWGLLPRGHGSAATREPLAVRIALITIAIAFAVVFLVLPLVVVFREAFSRGIATYIAAISNPEALDAIRLTLLVAAIAVPVNLVFGLAAAWSISKFDFRGKKLLVTLIDLPFAVSPVVSGLLYILVYGVHGWFGPLLVRNDLRVIFAVPGIILAATFVTLPFVARELIALMEAQGSEEEIAARVLGANGWQIFRHVTLKNVKWALLYGVVLANARAMGEFGAVSVVSGHVRGRTITLPLHVEVLYSEYDTAAAFAVASLLTLLALVTLVVKTWVEARSAGEQQPIDAPEVLD